MNVSRIHLERERHQLPKQMHLSQFLLLTVSRWQPRFTQRLWSIIMVLCYRCHFLSHNFGGINIVTVYYKVKVILQTNSLYWGNNGESIHISNSDPAFPSSVLSTSRMRIRMSLTEFKLTSPVHLWDGVIYHHLVQLITTDYC